MRLTARTDARDPSLEARLVAEPDDELAAVYADWLIEQGNPLGELFACATDADARARVLAKFGTLWGPAAEHVKLFDVTWGRAGVDELATKHSSIPRWARSITCVLDRPCAMFCRTLVLGSFPYDAVLQFETLLGMVGQRPALRRLYVHGGAALVGIAALTTQFPNLTSLRLTAGYNRDETAVIAHPKIEQLRLQLASNHSLGANLELAELPALRALAIATHRPQPDAGGLGGLIAAPWLAQLVELDVRGLGLGADAREILVATYGDRFAHLRLVT